MHELHVNLDDFIEALEPFKRLRKAQKKQEVVIRFDDSTLWLTTSHIGVGMRAAGTWDEPCSVSILFIHAFAKAPPKDDPVVLSVKDNRLYVGKTSSIACQFC